MNNISFLILILFVSCKSVIPQQKEEKELKKEINPNTIFYFFKATQLDSKVVIRLIKTKIVQSKTKGNYTNRIDLEKYKTNNWLVSFKNKQEKIVSQIQIKNPLIEEIEFINNEGNFKKKRIKHLNKDFVIRLPYDNSIKIITFEHLIIKNQEINKEFFNLIRL